MSDINKVSLGLGAALILLGAVSLGIGFGDWTANIAVTLLGICVVLGSIEPILGSTGQKVTRGLVIGVGVVVVVIFVLRIAMVIP